MSGALSYSLRDLYPTMGITDTSDEVITEAEDREALTENASDAETASNKFARGKFMLLGVGVLLAVVFFLGGAE